MKKILITLGVLIIVGLGANFLFPSIKSTKDLPFIIYTEVFSQKQSEYFVYFYQETCEICKEFEPDILKAARDNNMPIYVVDLLNNKNESAWYDWDTHHEKYTRVIGQIVNGEEVFNEGESPELYPEEDGWTLTTTNNEITLERRPQNNRAPRTPEEISIPWTPVLLHIKDGEVIGYSEGINEGQLLLAQFGQ